MLGTGLLLTALFAVAATGAALALTETDEPAGSELFIEQAHESGLDYVHFSGRTGKYYFSEIVGPGGALFDYDNDGDLDLFITQGNLLGAQETLADALDKPSGPLTDRLYRNDLTITADGERTLHFTDVTDASGLGGEGYAIGAATGDIDNDGDVDLYVTHFGANRLYRNNGDGTFVDTTEQAAVEETRWSVSATFLDFDRDGWLDLYVGNYVDYSIAAHKLCRTLAGAPDYCGPHSYRKVPDRLFHNNGDGTFSDYSARSQITTDFGGALGVVTADFNLDGWLDVYVGNDGTPNQMWINQQDGTFRNEALLAGTAVNAMGTPEASMGVVAGDFDGDGDEDLFLTHLLKETNTLYLNDGTGLFDDKTVETGLGEPSWQYTGFGTAWIDYDNDGWLDILAANGEVKVIPELEAKGDAFPLHQPNQLFHNLGRGRFEDATRQAGSAFELSEVSRGVAIGDLDNDGDSDVVLLNNSGPVRLLINQVGQHQHWVGLQLTTGAPAHDLPGSWVGVYPEGGKPLWRRSGTGGSYASASDPRVLVGLGTRDAVERVVVHWPNGSVEQFSAQADGYVTLQQGMGQALPEQGAP